MSHPARQFNRFDGMADSPDPRLAVLPKGTLPPRHMTGRDSGKYRPEAVYVPGLEFSAPIRNSQGGVAKEFYAPENRKRLVDVVVAKLNELGIALKADQVPAVQVDNAMKEGYTIYGMSPTNAPQAAVGPSESMSYLAPASKYHMDFGQGNPESRHAAELGQLNVFAARFLLDGILSERALIGRYHSDLSGAIHVLSYPTRPGPDMRRGHQLNLPYYDDISRDASQSKYTGLQGNNLRQTYLVDDSSQSVLQEPNQVQFARRL